MKVVIEIPEDEYNIAKYGQYGNINVNIVRKAIANGIPLPKGHGRLIDADALNIHDVSPAYGMEVYGVTQDDIEYEPTIIEADKEGKE